MACLPLMDGERKIGELTTAREGLYTCFRADCALPETGVFCVWAVGETGEVRIGIPEPVNGRGCLSRRFSDHVTAPAGTLLRGELRPAGETENGETWEPLPRPETAFRTPWLCGRLRGLPGVLTARSGALRRVAIPYDGSGPFPLTGLFCLARIGHAVGKRCVIYTFDSREQPVFP